MPEWIVSPPDKAAYIDLRGDELSFDEAERLLNAIQPYYVSPNLEQVVIDVRGLDPIPGPVDVLVVAVEAQAATAGIRVDVVRADPAPSAD
jgi:hypothetical protein